eukprot:m51a1_g7450 putative 60S ribosomal protein L15 (147) ;mRNA; r:105235-106078
MTTRLRNTRKLRGHVTMGCGRIIKHRKHQGGRGNAGGFHHHRTLLDKYHPGYFGKVGMRHFHYKINKFWRPSTNIDALWSLVPETIRKNWKEGDPVPVVDVTKKGYFKVLGKGHLPTQPIIVMAKLFTKRAEDKIKRAGGVCILTA